MRERFDGAQITAADLKELDRYGPGGVIYAGTHSGEYGLTHTRRILACGRSPVIIYGHGDLRYDLTRHYDGNWDALAEALTARAGDEIETWVVRTLQTPRLVTALRRDARRHHLYLNGRPQHSWTEDGALRIDDRLAYTREPGGITFTMTYVQRHTDSLMVALAMYDQGHYVATWPDRVTTSSGTPSCLREAPVRVGRRLDLRN